MFWLAKDDSKMIYELKQAEKSAQLRKLTEQKLATLEESLCDVEISADKANKRVIAQRDRIDSLFKYLGLEEQSVEAHTKIVKVKK